MRRDRGDRRGLQPCDRLGVEEDEDPIERRISRTLTIFVPEGALFRRTIELHSLALYAPEEVEAALAKAGFVSARAPSYDGLELMPGWHAFLATKPRP